MIQSLSSSEERQFLGEVRDALPVGGLGKAVGAGSERNRQPSHRSRIARASLATNSGKYGALSVDPGHIDVRWRLEGDIFIISWTQHNGPPVSPPERHGFSSTVVGSMVERIRGNVQEREKLI
jgi:hypothetical protein